MTLPVAHLVPALVEQAKTLLRISGPMPLAVALLVAAALLYVAPRWGRRLVLALAIGFWILSTPVGSRMLAAPLSRGFAPLSDAAAARQAGAIVVLGGGILENQAGGDVIARPGRETSFRILEAARVFRLLDGRPLVIASGGKPWKGQTTPEGDVIADALVRLSIPRERIVVESSSTTTYEQAVFVAEMLRQRGIVTIVLITSPTHMRRSVAVFQAQHVRVIPSVAPLGATEVDDPATFLPGRNALGVSDVALYDYAALAYYWARGWLRTDGKDR